MISLFLIYEQEPQNDVVVSECQFSLLLRRVCVWALACCTLIKLARGSESYPGLHVQES